MMLTMRELVGQSLSDRYRLMSRIAGGGMGEVYRAHDLLLDRPVAVKVMRPSLARDPSLVDRFKAEARAAGRLSHANVVAVHDWGEHSGDTYYMVMEYVAGMDLRDVLKEQGRVAPEMALEIVASVCDALHAAHRGGLVHRDVKPENVLIAPGGVVKVADFGIAALASARSSHQPGFGTIRYMAPEQAAGGEATGRSDVWAAGAMLGELVTGWPPANGAGAESLARRAVAPPRPPSLLDATVPHEIDALVLRACAVDPGERFSSADQMAEELRSLRAYLSPRTPDLSTMLRDETGRAVTGEVAPTALSEERRARLHGGRRRRRVLLPAALALALIIAGAVRALGGLLAPDEVGVPSLVGLERAEAESRVDRSGLELKVVGRVEDLGAPRGEVLTQRPSSGVLQEGSPVRVGLSSGPPPATVPDVAGMELSTATVRLRASGLRPGEVTRAFALEPAGTVMEQSPGGGRRPWGSAVDLVVSRGPRSIGVPDVVEMTASKAKDALARRGFSTVPTDTYSDDVPKGKVVSTEPEAGAVADEGSEVTLHVSVGPEFEEVTMPDVRGLSVAAARKKLAKLGLRVEIVQSCGGHGATVVESDPVARDTTMEGDVAGLFVC